MFTRPGMSSTMDDLPMTNWSNPWLVFLWKWCDKSQCHGFIRHFPHIFSHGIHTKNLIKTRFFLFLALRGRRESSLEGTGMRTHCEQPARNPLRATRWSAAWCLGFRIWQFYLFFFQNRDFVFTGVCRTLRTCYVETGMLKMAMVFAFYPLVI